MPLQNILISRAIYPDVVDACDNEATQNRLHDTKGKPRTATKVAVDKLRKSLKVRDVKQASVDESTVSKTDSLCQGNSNE